MVGQDELSYVSASRRSRTSSGGGWTCSATTGTTFVNYSGRPAASIPAGLADGRLPVGMELIGRRYADADMLASAAFERIRPWQDSYRICASRPL